MNTTLHAVSVEQGAKAATAPRVVSIDIFRGLTMTVMIFVNELASAHGMPWWTEHAPANVDVMTYVDMVFPFFLFLVGMSMPLSVAQRLKRNGSLVLLWMHIAVRVAGLVALGLILANAEKGDAARMGFSGSMWALIALLCAALYLNVYSAGMRSSLVRVIRFSGFAGVVILFALFRGRGAGGHGAWIDGSYPEILGLIGYTYLAVAILYLSTRSIRWMPFVWFVLLIFLCGLSTAKAISFPRHVPLYFWPFGNGAMASIVMAGIITASFFVGNDRQPTTRRAMMWAGGFALFTLVTGRVLTPLGISKIRATPTWSLYSIAAAVLVFALLYWVCDVKRHLAWATWLRPAGSNTLLTYLLPDLWYFFTVAAGITYFDSHFSAGWPAVLKTVLFTVAILGLSAALTKTRVRMKF